MKIQRIAKILSSEWRNENPGEGGTARRAVLNDGSSISLGTDGFALSRVEGGWKSKPCRAIRAVAGDLLVTKPLFPGSTFRVVSRDVAAKETPKGIWLLCLGLPDQYLGRTIGRANRALSRTGLQRHPSTLRS